MNKLWKKTIAVGIFVLFVGMTLMPTISAINQKNETIGTQISANTDIFDEVTIENPEEFQSEMQLLLSDLTMEKNNFDNLRDLLNWLLNKSDFPVLSYLLSQLINTERLQDRELILSLGWDYDLNPLKKNQFKIMKPLKFWLFTESSNLINLPSTTIVISSNPFNIQRVMGNQIGFVYRFRGLYGHMPQQFPKQSFTYMIGTAKGAAAFELPTLQLFAS